MNVQVAKEDGYWSLYVDGRQVLSGEGYQLVCEVEAALLSRKLPASVSEAAEIAEAIRREILDVADTKEE